MLKLRTFGGLSVEGGEEVGATGAALQRRPLALLAVLAANCNRGCRRDDLLLYLWPESTPERARNVLKQTLYALRRDLKAPDLFLTEYDTLRLNPAVISSDLGDFVAALEREDLPAAVELYRGWFLEGFHLKDSPEFERWRDGLRARCSQEFARAIATLAQRATQSGQPTRAIELWRRLTAISPHDVPATLALMDTLVAAGKSDEAVQHALKYESLSREQLGREPDPAVLNAAAQIRAARRDDPHSQRGIVTQVSSRAQVGRANGISNRASLKSDPITAPDDTFRKRAAETPRTGLPRWAAVTWWLPAAAVLIAIAAAGITRLAHRGYARRHLDPNLVVVAPFRVLDPELELWREGMVDVLARNLDGAGPLRTLGPSTALRSWSGGANPETAAALGLRTGAALAVMGTLLRAGPDSVRLTATLVDTRAGRVLGTVELRELRTRMDRLTDVLTLSLIRELEDRGVIRTGDRTLISSVTSFEALKAFLRGEQFYRRSQWDSAFSEYQRALAHDSSFVLAIRRMGNVLGWQRLTVDSLALSYLLRAGALNHGLSPRDSLLVVADSLLAAASLASSAIEEWRLTRRLFATLGLATQRYPETAAVWLALGEAQYHFGTGPVLGVTERENLATLDRAIALDSAFGPAYIHQVELGFRLGGPELGLRYARKYLALDPTEPAHRGVRLVTRLVGPARLQGQELDRLLDTVSTEALVSARTILRRWPDSAETAITLSRLLAQGRPSNYRLFSDTAFMRRRLAAGLAFRGHLNEAYRTLGKRELPLFAELAYLGAVAPDTASAVFRSWRKSGSPYARLALPWWSSVGDTASISEFGRKAGQLARAASDEAARVTAQYDTSAARAHMALANKDSVEALKLFKSLPDTLCPECYLDRLVRARLLTSRRRYGEALTDLSEPLAAFLTPIEVVFALERARAAERVGELELARAAYSLVGQAWSSADAQLQPLVREAHHWGRPRPE